MTLEYKEISPFAFKADHLIGSLVRLSKVYQWGTNSFSFWSIHPVQAIEIHSGSILMYLGHEDVDEYAPEGLRLGKETRYKFLFDNKIFYSVDPARTIPERSFKWELMVEVDHHGMPIQTSL